MRLSQHERLEIRLRQAKASSDALTVARIHAKITDRALAVRHDAKPTEPVIIAVRKRY
jgi:hypothetical protein